MPVTVKESVESRRVDWPRFAEYVYFVTGTDSQSAALAAVRAIAPADHDGLPQDVVSLRPLHVDSESGSGLWEARVTYSPRASAAGAGGSGGGGGEPEKSIVYEIGNTSSRLFAAKSTVCYPTEQYVIGDKRSIGVRPDGTVDGCDIVVPVFHYSEGLVIAKSTMDSKRMAIANLVGKINSAAFRGWSAGEVLFLGCDASLRSGGTSYDATFRFAISPKRTNVQIGDITIQSVGGWDYIDVYYDYRVAENQPGVHAVPLYVRVHTVYESGDFGALPL